MAKTETEQPSWRDRYYAIRDRFFSLEAVILELCIIRFKRNVGAKRIKRKDTRRTTSKTPFA